MHIIQFCTPSCFFVNTIFFITKSIFCFLLDCTGSCMVDCPSTRESAKKKSALHLSVVLYKWGWRVGRELVMKKTSFRHGWAGYWDSKTMLCSLMILTATVFWIHTGSGISWVSGSGSGIRTDSGRSKLAPQK